MGTLRNISRWVLVIPGSLAAAFAATFPWHWAVLFLEGFAGKGIEGEESLGLGFLVRSIGPETVERLGYGFITPFVVIIVSAMIAPTGKVIVGRVMGISFAVLLVVGSFLVPEYNQIDYFREASGFGKLYPVALVALWVAGIYAGLIVNKNRYE